MGFGKLLEKKMKEKNIKQLITDNIVIVSRWYS